MKAVRLGGCDVDRGVLMTNERANTLLGIRRDARAILCYQEREVCVCLSLSLSLSHSISLFVSLSHRLLIVLFIPLLLLSHTHTHKVEGADSCA